ncbi:glycosyltransferase family 2 protein [Sulfurimonas sp. HSL-3221]|uniref:glycosyltransferase family 2 protein n=1 Tax=Sulfurimonadaceae TaxID=2771471 RepID=UPI001E568C59|nr:glycosyltransferase family 2 protein [Sulfurimonas sp. HSL-3221]UFS62400.1 glycosyltransferase family 2 protein [Sulfurimonas sp. HSL-3221]
MIIPAYNEERYIAACLDSFVASDYPKAQLELFVVDGMSTDRTGEIVAGYAATYSWISLLENRDRTAPYAMNLGIGRASGDFIVRADAHSSYPADYLSKLIHWSQKLDADNVGGLWQTDVLHATAKSMAIKNVLRDRFGVGNALFRTGVRSVQEVDTVPFGCFKKEVFDRYGLYDTRLTRNQDIELNKRIKRGGGRIFLVPDIRCTYYARETFMALAKNNFANGKWNLLTADLTGTFGSLSVRHFVPLVFVLVLLLPLLFSPLLPQALYLSVTVLLLYTGIVLLRAWQIKYNTTLLYQCAAFFVLHFSYGLGELAGTCSVLKTRLKRLMTL